MFFYMPMHEVTPKVVAMAVSTVMITCNTLLQISFFSMMCFDFMIYDFFCTTELHGVSQSFFFFMLLEHPPPPFTRGIPYTHPPSEGGKGDVAAIGLETLKELRGTPCYSVVNKIRGE